MILCSMDRKKKEKKKKVWKEFNKEREKKIVVLIR